MASATVSFGMVSIPVNLYSSSDYSGQISLNWLHEKCGSRVRQKYYCPTCEEQVERSDMVKGFEYAKGQYVLFTEEEVKELQAAATQAIEITEFVPLAKVDPVYFERSYYLGPGKAGDRPYRLLAEAMKQTGRAALARYAARGKEYLVLLRPFGEGLIMQQLRYADEIKDFSEVPLGEAEVKEAELELAKQLVEQIATDEFEPGQYEDRVRQDMWSKIESKVEGKELTAAPEEAPKAQIIDLMDALKASLGSEEKAKQAAKPKADAGEQKKAAAG